MIVNIFTMRKIIIPIITVILFGCNTKTDKKKADTTIRFAKTEAASTDTIQVKESKLDTTFKIHMFWNGEGIEANPTLGKLPWKALTLKNNSYYLQDTKIKLKRQLYPEGSEDEGYMGLFMSSTDKDVRYLLTGLNVANGPIETVDIKRQILYPGQKEKFDFKGTAYTLYATGNKMDSVENGYNNYKLFLTANVKGLTLNQVLISSNSFGDVNDAEILSDVRIDFIGDIDGDNIPDIILTESGNFWGLSKLYLSSVAANKSILKHVAAF